MCSFFQWLYDMTRAGKSTRAVARIYLAMNGLGTDEGKFSKLCSGLHMLLYLRNNAAIIRNRKKNMAKTWVNRVTGRQRCVFLPTINNAVLQYILLEYASSTEKHGEHKEVLQIDWCMSHVTRWFPVSLVILANSDKVYQHTIKELALADMLQLQPDRISFTHKLDPLPENSGNLNL